MELAADFNCVLRDVLAMMSGIWKAWIKRTDHPIAELRRRTSRANSTAVAKQAAYAKASRFQREGKLQEALELFEEMAQRFPRSVRAYRGCALCRLGLKDFAGAKVDTERWIANLEARSETDADAYFHLGECLQGLNEKDAALAAMTAAVAINPFHSRALRALDRQ